MPFFLVTVGAVFIVSAIRNTQVCLFHTIQGDFALKQGSFTYWLVALLLFGALGYSETLRPISEALLVLVILALLLTKASGTAQAITFFGNLTRSLGVQSSSGTNITSTLGNIGSTFLGDQNPPGGFSYNV